MPCNVAALYDIHGNLPALEAVLREVEQLSVDALVVGGDVAPGPMSAECLRRLRAHPLPTHFIRGNGDREVAALARGGDGAAIPEPHRSASRWVAEQFSSAELDLMEAWPTTLDCQVAGLGPVLFCHATPRDDNELFTVRTPEADLVEAFAIDDAQLVVCGHTHMQFDRQVGGLRVVNAGSVGMPFGRPGAFWLRLGDGVELRRTSYDLGAAEDLVRASRYPLAKDFAQRNILTCPGDEEMIALFEAARTNPTV